MEETFRLSSGAATSELLGFADSFRLSSGVVPSELLDFADGFRLSSGVETLDELGLVDNLRLSSDVEASAAPALAVETFFFSPEVDESVARFVAVPWLVSRAKTPSVLAFVLVPGV